eukprot:scaffold1585_cov52-Attheya_sp.AAC.5
MDTNCDIDVHPNNIDLKAIQTGRAATYIFGWSSIFNDAFRTDTCSEEDARRAGFFAATCWATSVASSPP